MSRHTDIPPFARQYGANHPAVRHRILQEIERDVIGYADKRGNIHFFKDEQDKPERGADWCAILFWFSILGIILLLGIGGGLWLTS